MTLRRTGYVWHEQYAWHDTGTNTGYVLPGGAVQAHHTFESPESKSRLAGLIEVSGLLDQLHRIRATPASTEQILRVHSPAYLARLIEASSAIRGGDAGDGSTPVGRGSYEIAALAAGGTIAAAAAVWGGEVDNAYALVRPPGHHAERDLGRGFCLLSNVCIAIEELRETFGLERFAIVDYDVHHGNGAQAIYAEDPSVLAISIHQDRLFPTDSGTMDELGTGAGVGTNLNLPLPAGCGNGAYLDALQRVVRPALRAFAPEIIFVSSGFDAGALDPLGCMSVTARGFGEMASLLLRYADEVCDGKIVFSHEGGYSPVQVPFCGLAVLEAMSGHATGVDDPFGPSFDHSPAQQLQPWQAAVIDQAAELADRLSGSW